MARSKKKKWKSRIKKALKLAAIGGATYLAAKRFGGKKATVADTAASEDAYWSDTSCFSSRCTSH
jgi:uroporphyrinogen-III synthase